MLQLYFFITFFASAGGARIRRTATTANAIVGLAPEVLNMLKETMETECAFKLINDYSKWIGEDKIRIAMRLAEEKMESDKVVLEELTVLKEQAIDSVVYPTCSIGMPLIPCFETLPPMVWLKQRWALKELLKDNEAIWYKPWSQKRDEDLNETRVGIIAKLFATALKETNFSASRAKVHCSYNAKKPVLKDVRGCVIEKAVAVSPAFQDVLIEKWTYVDRKELLMVMGNRWYDFRRRKELEKTKTIMELSAKIREVDVDLQGFDEAAATKECKKFANASKLVAVKARTHQELTTSCNLQNACHEKFNNVAPAGYACDTQRDFTPERSFVAFWLGDFLAMGLYPAIGGTVGFFTGGPAGAASMAATWAMIPNFPWDIIFGSAFAAGFSRKLWPECMAFPMNCGRDSKAGPCEMITSSGTMRASTNRFARLPMDGFKCTPGETLRRCELQACTIEDVSAAGPIPGLFGRTGRFKGGTYNCANTGRSRETMLGNLESLPALDSSGTNLSAEQVPNTVQTRNALLHLYPEALEVEDGFKGAKIFPRVCTEEAEEEMSQKGFRISRRMKGGRLYLTCKGEATTEGNKYKVSCNKDDCEGDSWCFVHNRRRAPEPKCPRGPEPNSD